MKQLVALLLLGMVFGTATYYSAERAVKVAVVDYDEGYISIRCCDHIHACKNSSFKAFEIGNGITDVVEVTVESSDPSFDLSGDFYVQPGCWHDVTGWVGNIPNGTYIVPVVVEARWSDGSAKITKSLIVVVGGCCNERNCRR